MIKIKDFIDSTLLEEGIADARYVGSPFEELKKLPPKQKGKRMELIVKSIFAKLGFLVEEPLSSDHDAIIARRLCELKGSTMVSTLTKPTFSFLQIRPLQEYDKIIFSMFYPSQLMLMEMSKKDVLKCVENNVFKKQHEGKNSEGGTYCYYGNEKTLESVGASHIITLD